MSAFGTARTRARFGFVLICRIARKWGILPVLSSLAHHKIQQMGRC